MRALILVALLVLVSGCAAIEKHFAGEAALKATARSVCLNDDVACLLRRLEARQELARREAKFWRMNERSARCAHEQKCW
jgi:hypothetical protein